MIIWLASYPKSGNTWIRSFLYSLLFSKDNTVNLNELSIIDQYPTKKYFKGHLTNYSDFVQISKKWDITQQEINKDKKIRFFKTHHYLCNINGYKFIELHNTLGVIHIVRDPRNIITSVKNHYSLNSYIDALNFLKDENHCIDVENKSHENIDKKDILNTLISSWSNNYKSWKAFPKNNLLVKYEDLVHNPFKTFNKIVLFLEILLKIKIDKTKIKKAIEENSFEKLKKIEEKYGFKESVTDKKNTSKKFFFLGPENNWENLLPVDIRWDIEKSFANEMKELKYL